MPQQESLTHRLTGACFALCMGVITLSSGAAEAGQKACTLNVCAPEQNMVRQWDRISGKLETGQKPFKSLEEISVFVNNFRYRSDMKNYGVSDYWASPKRFFKKKSGDCEDYVIAKYALALEAGLTKSTDARLELVFDRQEQVYHMVLIIGNLVLDNQSKKIITVNKASKQRYDILGEVRSIIAQLQHA